MSGLTVKIGADVSGFERGQRDAVSSARRGAQDIAVAYVASGALAKASMQSLAINLAAVQLASGNVASTMSGVWKTSFIDGFAEARRGSEATTSSLGSLEDKLRALPSPIAAVVEGFALFQAVTTVWQAFNQALEDTEVRLARLNAISTAAKQLGTGPTFLTSLIAQAKQLGVETEALTGMLTRAREASRVQIGVGKDAVNESAFQTRLRQNVMAGNVSQGEAAPYNNARTQEAQIRAVLDLLDTLKAKQMEVAANDLGRTFFGADFEAKTRQGIDLIGAFRAALEGAKIAGGGLAPTPEELDRAKEFAAREEAIAAVIRDAIAPAVHDFNEMSDVGKRTWLEWQEHVAGWVKWLGEGYLKIRDVAAQVRQMAADWGLIGQPGGEEREGGPLTIKVKARPKAPDRSNPLPSLGTAARTPRDAQDPDSVANVIRQLEKARDLAEAELKTVGLSNQARERAVDIAKAEAAARADVEKGVRSSLALTDEETKRILAAADATSKFKDAQKDLEQSARQAADTARYFGQQVTDGLADVVLDGKDATDAVLGLAKAFERAALQAAFLGTGPLAGLLGTAPLASAGPNALGGLLGLFSGSGSNAANAPVAGAQGPTLAAPGFLAQVASWLGFAEGGYTGDGGRDEPAGIVHRGEYVVPKVAVARIGVPMLNALARGMPGYAGGGFVGGPAASTVVTRMASQPVINVGGTTINAPNADAAGLAKLRAYVDAKDAQLPKRINDIQRRAA